ncbi:bifunctional diaminohydroxyphosphoribosylaminopyrimidine deaminase/5-amino-6-(5-phosphoribosylamino)uracil reductase RibD [Actinotalea lenta]
MPRRDADEREAMWRALELAARGPAHGPNPQVGAVLLDPAGRRIGEGWHAGAGTPHAEPAALADARSAGHDPRGATMVVTLEPCRHTGRTGPCTHALIAAGVARVVYALDDPSPTAGGGAGVLRSAGLEVVGGLLAEQADTIVHPWLTAVRRGRPWVTLKHATTLDGRVAAADGSSRWITSPAARRHAHRLRAQVDAIVVGTGTALRDDPALTARDENGGLSAHQPLRVVVGRRTVPAGARLRGLGGPLVEVRDHDPSAVLTSLAEHEVRHVLVEGGPTVAAAFLRAGLVDEVHAYLAAAYLGAGPAAVGDLAITSIDGALRLTVTEATIVGGDVLVVARNQEE